MKSGLLKILLTVVTLFVASGVARAQAAPGSFSYSAEMPLKFHQWEYEYSWSYRVHEKQKRAAIVIYQCNPLERDGPTCDMGTELSLPFLKYDPASKNVYVLVEGQEVICAHIKAHHLWHMYVQGPRSQKLTGSCSVSLTVNQENLKRNWVLDVVFAVNPSESSSPD